MGELWHCRIWEQYGRTQHQGTKNMVLLNRAGPRPTNWACSIESQWLQPTLFALLGEGELEAALLLGGCKHHGHALCAWVQPAPRTGDVQLAGVLTDPAPGCLV